MASQAAAVCAVSRAALRDAARLRELRETELCDVALRVAALETADPLAWRDINASASERAWALPTDVTRVIGTYVGDDVVVHARANRASCERAARELALRYHDNRALLRTLVTWGHVRVLRELLRGGKRAHHGVLDFVHNALHRMSVLRVSLPLFARVYYYDILYMVGNSSRAALHHVLGEAHATRLVVYDGDTPMRCSEVLERLLRVHDHPRALRVINACVRVCGMHAETLLRARALWDARVTRELALAACAQAPFEYVTRVLEDTPPAWLDACLLESVSEQRARVVGALLQRGARVDTCTLRVALRARAWRLALELARRADAVPRAVMRDYLLRTRTRRRTREFYTLMAMVDV